MFLFIYCVYFFRLSELDIDPKNEKTQSFQDEVNNCAKCRSESACSRNYSETSSMACNVPDYKDKREVTFCTSDIHKNDRSSRVYKSSKESVAAKWNAVEKFICTGQKMNTWTREQVSSFDQEDNYQGPVVQR